jgi:hypothetical protein
MPQKKPRKCRICKKRPVWRGGDVKDPGLVCKQCYHKHVWPERRAADHAAGNDADQVTGSGNGGRPNSDTGGEFISHSPLKL